MVSTARLHDWRVDADWDVRPALAKQVAALRVAASLVVLGLLSLAVCGCSRLPGLSRPSPRLEPGHRIRVRVREAQPSRQAGTLVALTADSLVLRTGTAATAASDATRAAIPVAAITRVEVSTGVHRQVFAGAVYGGQVGLIGMLAGSLAGAWIAGDAESMAMFAGGLVAGAAIGAAVEKENWRRRPLGSIRVAVVPLPAGGLGIGLGLAVVR